jgi:hypothetical protein
MSRPLAILASIGLIGASVVFGSSVANAAGVVSAPTGHVSHHSPLAMGHFDSSDYARQAAKLPSGLVKAVKRDVGLAPAQYLADSAAAVHAVKVVDSLESVGVDVLGSNMSGTTLKVNVPSQADAAVVTEAGGVPVIGAPAKLDLSGQTFHTTSALYGGSAWVGSDTSAGGKDLDYRCSVGFNGYSTTSGAAQFSTAGHCAVPLVGTAYGLTQTVADDDNGSVTPQLGARVSSEAEFGSGYDYGIVAAGANVTPQASILTWGGDGAGAPLGSTPLPITGESAAIKGATICKSGSTSGWTCGTITAVDQNISVEDDKTPPVDHSVNGIVSTACMLPGDSGGAAVIGSVAVGVDSASSFTACSDSGKESIFFPMISAAGAKSVVGQQGSKWQIALTMPTPSVNSIGSSGTVLTTDAMTGTLSTAEAGATSASDIVSLYLDGSSTALETASASTGSWSLPLTTASSGTHTWVVKSSYGHSFSSSVSGSFTVAQGFTETKPTISGSAKVGSTLTAKVSSVPAADSYSYQWAANGTDIGTDTSTYTLTASELSRTITVAVTASKSGYTPPPAQTSTATAKVVSGTLVPIKPVVTGTRRIGDTLTATTKPWGPGTVTVSYTWSRNGSTISGATGSTYKQAWNDYGKKINVKVKGVESGYTTAYSATATSLKTGTGYFVTSTPIISSMTPYVGERLTVSHAGWAPTTSTFSYRWYVGGKSVASNSHSYFVVPKSALGKVITVKVVIKKTHYTTVNKTSAGTAKVTATAP